MKILHLLNDVRDIGNGINNLTVRLALQQVKDGHDVTVISAGGGYDKLLRAGGVTSLEWRELDSPRCFRRLPDWFAQSLLLKRLLTERPTDVVHAHNLKGALQQGYLRAWRRLSRKSFANLRLVCTLHLERKVGVQLMLFADAVHGFSPLESSQLSRVSKILFAAKYHCIPQGPLLNLDYKQLERPLDLAANSIVTVCGLYEHKGVFDLLEAVRILCRSSEPRIQAYFVGEGPARPELERRIDELGLKPYVHLVGYQSDVQTWMQAASVFVLASHVESAGLVLAEARQVGACIVATRVGGIPTMLSGGRAGLLVEPHAPDTLAYTLLSLLKSPDMQLEWRQKARKDLNLLTVSRYSRLMSRFYESSS